MGKVDVILGLTDSLHLGALDYDNIARADQAAFRAFWGNGFLRKRTDLPQEWGYS